MRPTRASEPLRGALVEWAERLGLFIAWAATIAMFGLITPETFFTWANFSTILGSQAVLVVLTLGLLVPLTAGDYDLSMASVLTLSSMIIAVLNVNHQIPIGIAVGVALAVGLLTGFLNGFFILYFRIHSLIVTLGIGTFLHGITLWISDSMTISGISAALVNAVIVWRFLGVPLEFYYAMAVCIAIWYVFSYTAMGRRVLFVGRGREVARLSGIHVDRVRWGALITSGFLSSLAGVLYAGTTGAADPSSGLTYLLPAFAAAFLGSTSIEPGRFNPWGATVAVYFLVTGITGLSILGVRTFVQDLFYGGALVVAVALSQIVRGREERPQ
ncbi:MAG: ABC transporter permease [Acidobacteriia bacterium]|nr:ABC transporter permease [Methyloceanibacter sp.]MCL6490633.1 ABC transporter permease [Terriglobia bacterium]